MRIVAVVGQDHVGLDATLETFKPGLDLRAVGGKEAVAEFVHLDARAIDPLEEIGRGGARLPFAGAGGREHAPRHVQIDACRLPLQDGTPGADLDVVGMRAQAQDGEVLARLG